MTTSAKRQRVLLHELPAFVRGTQLVVFYSADEARSKLCLVMYLLNAGCSWNYFVEGNLN